MKICKVNKKLLIMKNYIWIFGLILLSLISANGLDTSPGKILEEASKLDKAKAIFKSIADSDFVKTTKEVSKWGLPLLKSIGYFAKVIMGQFEDESKELKYMKEQFKIINEKMDTIDQQFDEVKKAINWNVVKVQYFNHEMSIGLLQDMIESIAEAPVNLRGILMDKFRMTYEQMYYSASDNLYESLTNPRRLFSENLVTAACETFNSHRRKVEKFFMGNIQLMIKGLEVESFYFNMKNLSSNQDYWAEQWDKKLNQITTIMEQTINYITDNWHKQLEIDAEDFNIKNYQKGNKEYLEEFYNFLNDKFHWREWFVVVYNPITGGNNHYVSVYNGIINLRSRGHNIAVASRDISDNNFNVGLVTQVLNNLPRNFNTRGKGTAESLLMDYLIPSLERVHKYSLATVIEWGAGVWFISDNRYRVYKKYEGNGRTFNIIVMG